MEENLPPEAAHEYLVEAARIQRQSGCDREKVDLQELMMQACGEYEEKINRRADLHMQTAAATVHMGRWQAYVADSR